MFNGKEYWENRYKDAGTSGLGSYGTEASFKAHYINNVIKKYTIKDINDFGCGDSNQIKMIKGFERYTGYDVSPTAIEKCKKNLPNQSHYNFINDVNHFIPTDLTLSLDVVYHLVELEIFEEYIHNLFKYSKKYVLIYSTNRKMEVNEEEDHLKSRIFTEYIEKHLPNATLLDISLFPPKGDVVGFYLYHIGSKLKLGKPHHDASIDDKSINPNG